MEWSAKDFADVFKPSEYGTNIERSSGKGHVEGDESNSVTKMVPISVVKRYREYDREGQQSHGSMSEETINNIANELKNGGVIKTPLSIYHSDAHNWGYLAEGHHRLIAAERAGLTHVPVYVGSVEHGVGEESRKEKGIGAPLHLTTNFSSIPGQKYIPPKVHPNHFAELR